MCPDRWPGTVKHVPALPDISTLASDAAIPFFLGIDWLDPEWLLDRFGSEFLWISLLILFIECGLFFPFLPGDALLFAYGIFVATERIDIFPGTPLVEMVIGMSLMIAAAFAGNIAGYEIGRKLGPPLYARDGRLLKRRYFEETEVFFEKHGNKALVIGRFVPIVRTFITVVAGVSRMDRRRFFTWSAVGAVLWAAGLTLVGYFLGKSFPGLADKLEIAIVLIVGVSVLPMVYEYLKHRREAKGIAAEVGEAASDLADRATDTDRTP
jgi:membrane-associated protein